jgi:hypothetical protein
MAVSRSGGHPWEGEVARLVADLPDASIDIEKLIERVRAVFPLDVLDPRSPQRQGVEQILDALDQRQRAAKNEERIEAELNAFIQKAEQLPDITKRLARQSAQRLDRVQRSIDRAARGPGNPGCDSRVGSGPYRVLFRLHLGRRRSRKVRRSAQTTPRRAQSDSGDSDDGGDGPGSSCPPKSSSLTTEGSRSSRLWRLRTSGGQFASCASAVAGFEGGLP